MPATVIDLIALAGVVCVLTAPIEGALGVIVGFWLLVPGTLAVPHGPHLLYLDRLVLYTMVLRLAMRFGRPGEPSLRAYRPGLLHGALALYVVVGWLDGVVLAPRTLSLASDLHGWLDVVDLLVLFVVVLAVARTIGYRRVLRLVACGLAGAMFLGIVERVWMHGGWSHYFFEKLPSQVGAPGSYPLERRGGGVRIQGAAQFALEYGWVLAMFLPLLAVLGLNWFRRLRSSRRRPWLSLAPLLFPGVGALCVVLTASRSAEIGAVLGILIVLVASGAERRLAMAVGFGAVVVLAIALVSPSVLSSPFTAAANTNSVSLRLNRLPDVFALVVGRSFQGLGFSGVHASLPGLDDAYVLLYGTLGVIGLLAWLTMVTTAIARAGRALRAHRSSEVRLLAAAVVSGLVLCLVAAASYDSVVTYQSTWSFVFLAALGVALAETAESTAPARQRLRGRRVGLRVALPILATACGFGVLAATPSRSSQTYSIYTIAPWVLSESRGYIDDYTGKVLANTLCPLVTAKAVRMPGSTVRCVRATDVVPLSWDGLVDVRVGAADPRAVLAAARLSLSVPMPVTISADEPVQSGKPAWATTAPLWLGTAGLLAALLVSPKRFRDPPLDPNETPGRQKTSESTGDEDTGGDDNDDDDADTDGRGDREPRREPALASTGR